MLSKIDYLFYDDPNIDSMDKDAHSLTITKLTSKYPKYSNVEYQSALILLESNNHIVLEYPEELSYDPNDRLIVPTAIGREAYLEEFYTKENQKDRLESIELYSKWIMPILSFLVACAALWVSIYSSHRK